MEEIEMKLLTKSLALAMSVMSFGAFADDSHKHENDPKHTDAHKDETCKKCKKSEKDCKCDEKDTHEHDDHDHDHSKEDAKKKK